MSDLSALLINRVRESLEKLEREHVGYIDIEDASGFQYHINGRAFCINVKELGVEK
jgi:hypothetical protein